MNDHERARELIALEDKEATSGNDLAWLRNHLQECAACREYAARAASAVRALRGEPLQPMDPVLTRTIQIRVQARARQLGESRARTRVIWAASVLIGLASVPTTSLSWRTLGWMGNFPFTAAEISSAFFLILPALVVAGVLITRDVDLTDSH